MGDFLSSFVMYFLTGKSVGTPTRDLEFGREVAFPFVSSLLGNFARSHGRGGGEGHPGDRGPISGIDVFINSTGNLKARKHENRRWG